jgi:tRNA pseudouridine synthase 10
MKPEVCVKCAERIDGEVKIVRGDECIYCEGKLWKINRLASVILRDLSGYEFDTFVVGTRIEGSLKALEEYFAVYPEKSIKYEFNRLLGIEISKISGKKVNFEKPDVTVLYNPEKDDFEYSIRSLYISGRYIKRVRNISQTRWFCSYCGGKGCEMCNFAGKKYLSSVEELIAEPAVKVTDAKNAILHGSGREDVDARMLGRGRPFVLEIIYPKKRSIDLKSLEELIKKESENRVEVRSLEFTDEKMVRFLKTTPFKKKYRAKVRFERTIAEEELKKAVEKLSYEIINQRTPTRVEHRRADIVRRKKVYEIDILMHKNDIAVLEIVADSGLYIKELISGDEGRTSPSLTEFLCKAKVEKLDVIDIFDEV